MNPELIGTLSTVLAIIGSSLICHDFHVISVISPRLFTHLSIFSQHIPNCTWPVMMSFAFQHETDISPAKIPNYDHHQWAAMK
jgi:hypothetical protein